MGVSLRITSGPALERAGDLAAILTNLDDGDVLFIDEIHRLPRPVEEVRDVLALLGDTADASVEDMLRDALKFLAVNA